MNIHVSAVNISKKEMDDIPTIFAWSCDNAVVTSLTYHPENHVSTCTTDLAKLYTEDKEILVKPTVVSVENSTDLKVFSDAATNTDVMQKGDASI